MPTLPVFQPREYEDNDKNNIDDKREKDVQLKIHTSHFSVDIVETMITIGASVLKAFTLIDEFRYHNNGRSIYSCIHAELATINRKYSHFHIRFPEDV